MRFIKVIDQDDCIIYIATNKIAGVNEVNDYDISVRICDGDIATYQFNGDIDDFMNLVMSRETNPVFRSPRED